MGGSEADPHLTGFEGDRYDVQGEPGRWMLLLSDATVQLAALLGAVPAVPGATVNVAFALKVGVPSAYARVFVGLTPGGFLAELDGGPLPSAPARRLFPGGLTGKDGRPYTASVRREPGQGVWVDCGAYVLRLYRMCFPDPAGPLDMVPHLDARVDPGPLGILSDGVRPHGLIGCTADGDGVPRVPTGGQGQGVIEGTWGQYVLSGPWADDSPFCRFGRTPEGPAGFDVQS